MKSYYADIYISMSPGYASEAYYSKEYVEELIGEYVNEHMFAVNLQDTKFIYPGGSEDGLKIGLIQYPRFPATEETILQNAIKLAEHLMSKLNQFRCTVQTSDQVFLLENKNMPSEYADKK